MPKPYKPAKVKGLPGVPRVKKAKKPKLHGRKSPGFVPPGQAKHIANKTGPYKPGGPKTAPATPAATTPAVSPVAASIAAAPKPPVSTVPKPPGLAKPGFGMGKFARPAFKRPPGLRRGRGKKRAFGLRRRMG
jgi:hypothetical protein